MSRGNSFGRRETVNNDVSTYGELDVRGALKKSGVAITATAAEINKLAVASFNNKSGYVARVNSGETALEYVAPTAIPTGGTFTNKSKYVARVNAGETAMECVAPTALEIGGAFANHGRHKVRVNAGESALEYVADGELKNEVGTTYAFVLGDEGKVITFENDGAITATIPANAATAFPVGTEITLVQKGAGAVTVAITTDTLNVISTKTRVTAGAWSIAKLHKIAATVWVISGDLATA